DGRRLALECAGEHPLREIEPLLEVLSRVDHRAAAHPYEMQGVRGRLPVPPPLGAAWLAPLEVGVAERTAFPQRLLYAAQHPAVLPDERRPTRMPRSILHHRAPPPACLRRGYQAR